MLPLGKHFGKPYFRISDFRRSFHTLHFCRFMFLCDAYWSLKPHTILMAKPRLTLSTTFFTWIRYFISHRFTSASRCAASKIIAHLVEPWRKLGSAMVEWDHKHLSNPQMLNHFSPFDNPYRARFIHLYNLWTLMAFVIPAIQDYGIALKLNNNVDFMQRYLQLLLFLLYCDTPGAKMYVRNMTMFYGHLVYWKEQGLPIHTILGHFLTLFSEESGEIALGQLVFKMSKGGDPRSLDQANSHWQTVSHRTEIPNEHLPPHANSAGKRRTVEEDDEAIEGLLQHFKQVIDNIFAGTWRHLPCLPLDEGDEDIDVEIMEDEHVELPPHVKEPEWVKAKKFVREAMEPKRQYNNEPRPFALSSHDSITELLQKIQSSLDKNVVSKSNSYIGETSDDIKQTFGVQYGEVHEEEKKKTCKRKRKSIDEDEEYKPPPINMVLRRRTILRRSGESKTRNGVSVADEGVEIKRGSFTVEDILLEGVNQRGTVSVLIKWEGYDFVECTWEPITNLNQSVLGWWLKERERRYPRVSLDVLRYRR
jgi:hypothetical protein